MAESSLAQLPDDVDALKALISARDFALAEQHKKLAERDKKITILEEYVRLLKCQRFGKSSERLPKSLRIEGLNRERWSNVRLRTSTGRHQVHGVFFLNLHRAFSPFYPE